MKISAFLRQINKMVLRATICKWEFKCMVFDASSSINWDTYSELIILRLDLQMKVGYINARGCSAKS